MSSAFLRRHGIRKGVVRKKASRPRSQSPRDHGRPEEGGDSAMNSFSEASGAKFPGRVVQAQCAVIRDGWQINSADPAPKTGATHHSGGEGNALERYDAI